EGFAVPFLTTPANVAAIPAAVVCGGFSSAGLPLGVQIMGPAWGDGLVLRLAHHIEQALGTRTRRPLLAVPSADESGEPVPAPAGKGRPSLAPPSPGPA
ncbi:MAG: amidase family protein, partial [Stellaceae bacterium]